MKYSIEINGLRVDAVYQERDIDEIFLPLLNRLTQMQREKGGRIFVMLAAPPGAGKSTLASFLKQLSQNTPGLTPVTVIGMDGFHQRQEYLLTHTILRDGEEIPMVKIKGAPVTFDLDQLRKRLSRVVAGEDCDWPEYNRLMHNPVENGLQVKGSIILLEGNYLLLDEDGWRDLKKLADYTIKIIADVDMLRERLIARKTASGTDYDQAVQFVERSDLDNARLCLNRSMDGDLTLRLLPDGSYEITRGEAE